jgi:flagellar hook-basal body complex protein FliE
LKKSDFLTENNLYQENYFIKENDTIFHQSFSLNPEFNYKTSFSDYLRKSIYNYSKTSTQRHQFKGTFILTKDDEIREVTVERGINKSFDKSFKKAVQESQKYWKNDTGKDILIVQKFNFFEQGKYFVKKENWDFYHNVKKADSYVCGPPTTFTNLA